MEPDANMSEASRASSEQDHGKPGEAKRRKVRKGTRSCWECKRRKMRCVFSEPSDDACIACRKRGSSCVSQSYPEGTPGGPTTKDDRSRLMGERIVRVEALVEQLVKQAGTEITAPLPASTPLPALRDESPMSSCAGGAVYSTDASSVCWETPRQSSLNTFGQLCGTSSPSAALLTPCSLTPAISASINEHAQHRELSAALYAALPPREDIQSIIRAGIDVSFHKLLIQPLAVIEKTPGSTKGDLHKIPGPGSHPVILAKYILILCTCFQHADPVLLNDRLKGLSEPPQTTILRLLDVVVRLVLSKDFFLDSVEGVFCVLMQSAVEANNGLLRKAWFSCRRAMLLGQMMGLHRSGIQQVLKVLDPSDPMHQGTLWFRIVYFDRMLCLLLGLPQGSLDMSIGSDSALQLESPTGRFQRRQSLVAMRMLQRNESTEPGVMNDMKLLEDIDGQLQGAGQEMPSEWWLMPNPHDVGRGTDQMSQEMMRVIDQIMYFNLLNLLHLPYMLRAGSRGVDPYGQSTLACVTASRELLTRFIFIRSLSSVASMCRAMDFFALISAMTLVMAHLDSHRKRREGECKVGINVLAHQRRADRAMMEGVLVSMEKLTAINNDTLSKRSFDLLRSLLDLEANAADGKMHNNNFDAAAALVKTNPDSAKADGDAVSLAIPYFGTIQIDRDCVVTMEGLAQGEDLETATQSAKSVSVGRAEYEPVTTARENLPSRINTTDKREAPLQRLPLHPAEPAVVQRHDVASDEPSMASSHALDTHDFAPQYPSAINEALQDNYVYPGLTAGLDEWAFQGVDMAFFDALTRRTGLEATEESNWDNWYRE